MLITLSDDTLAEIRSIARARAMYGGSKKFDPRQSEYDIHFLGLLGEFAYGQRVGQSPNIKKSQGGIPGADFVVKGVRVEVKTANTARYSMPDLMVRTERADKADVFVLAGVDPDNPSEVTLIGYAYADELRERTITTKYSVNFIRYASELWRFKE